jgi:hypothetical protein
MVFEPLLGKALDIGIFLRWPRIPLYCHKARGELPRIVFPRSYTDRIQWRKVFDRNPIFVSLADKLAAKNYIALRCPDLALPKTLWTGTRIEDAPGELLAGDVVVKANHGSGQNFFIRAGRYDPGLLSRLTAAWMSQPYGQRDAEWAYHSITRRLFIEEMLGSVAVPPLEINIRAGHGRVGFGNILLYAKTPKQSVIYLNENGEKTHLSAGGGVTDAELLKVIVPEAFMKARSFAAQLTKDIDFARIDFFCADGRLYAGEITLYPQSGYAAPNPYEQSVMKLWDLRQSWFMQTEFRDWRAPYKAALTRHLDRTGQ